MARYSEGRLRYAFLLRVWPGSKGYLPVVWQGMVLTGFSVHFISTHLLRSENNELAALHLYIHVPGL